MVNSVEELDPSQRTPVLAIPIFDSCCIEEITLSSKTAIISKMYAGKKYC